MTYYVEISPVAQKFLNKLDKSIFLPLIKRIRKLKDNPLKHSKSIGDGYRELRYEKFRVYYDIMHDAILIERCI